MPPPNPSTDLPSQIPPEYQKKAPVQPPPDLEAFNRATPEEQLLMASLAYMIQTKNLGLCFATQESFQKWYEETAKRVNLRGK